MKTNTSTRSAFFSVRILFGFALCLLGVGLGFAALRVRPAAEPEHVRVVTENVDLARALPAGGDRDSEAEDLLRLEEYRHLRLAYPTGRFDPAWVRNAADQHNRNQRRIPGGKTLFSQSTTSGGLTLAGGNTAGTGDPTDMSALAPGPLSLGSTSFTSLGPNPENRTARGATC